MKRITSLLIKTAISAGFIGVIIHQINLSQVWHKIQGLDPIFIGYALLYYGCLQWLSCIRWQIILSIAGHSLPTHRLLRSYFAGMVLNIILPGAVGGDVYRIYQVSQTTNDSEAAFVSVFLERFTGLVALSGIALVGLPPALNLIENSAIVMLFLGCLAILVGGTVAIATPQLLAIIRPMFRSLKLMSLFTRMAKTQRLLMQFWQHRRKLMLSMALSLFLQLAIIYYHYLIAQQLSISISFWELLIFIPITVVITLLPVSLGGLGLKEGLWVYLFVCIGLSSDQAIVFSLTLMALSWLLSLPGIAMLAWNAAKRPQLDAL